jgi:peptidoglycan/LPS O-acetylase OafA/YrhL
MNPGLGSWRFFLAFLVAISHLWAGMIDGPAAYAVWAFFTLSGYLMTQGLATRYPADRRGLWQYARNRFLRIYPAYAAAMLLGLLTLAALHRTGISPAGLNPQFLPPQSGREWLANLAMLPLIPVRGLAVPVAAALFTEVAAYAVLPLLARSRPAAWASFVITLCANLQFGFGTETFIPRYCGLSTGLMPFALGALAWHHRHALRRFTRPGLSVAAWCAHGLYWLHDPSWPWTYGLYLSVPLSAWVAVSLAPVRQGPVDRLAGDLSYPVYLLHTTVAAWFLPAFGFARGFAFFAVAFAATLAAAFAMLLSIDRPLQRFRQAPPPPR